MISLIPQTRKPLWGVMPISKYYINSNCAVLKDSIYYLALIGSHCNKSSHDDTLELQVFISSQTLCSLILNMSGYFPFSRPNKWSLSPLRGLRELPQYILAMVLKNLSYWAPGHLLGQRVPQLKIVSGQGTEQNIDFLLAGWWESQTQIPRLRSISSEK